MFEAELELERKESSVIPLVLVLVLAGLILGGVGGVIYMVVQTKRGLPVQDATAIIERSLKQEAPALVHFQVGTLKSSVNEKPGDPHYKLLEKIGVITFKAQKDGRTFQVNLTSDGEKKIAAIPDVQKTPEKDGIFSYNVPLATRKLVQVSKVTMDGPNTARVIYSWKWEPNEFGNAFDAAGPNVKGFTQWDRATLIQKYSVDFYHAEPSLTAATLSKKDGQWTVMPND